MSNIKTKKLDGPYYEIESETPQETFSRFIKQATTQFIKETEIKGFRKGRAPEDLVIRQIGESALLERAAELTLSSEWPNILKEKKFEVIGHPEFQIIKIARGNPLVWRARFAIIPEVSLPDYKSIAKDVVVAESGKTITVEEKEVNDLLKWLVTSKAKKEQPSPKPDDDFAKSMGNFSTIDALKEHLRENILLDKKLKEKERIRVAILEKIAEKTNLEIPDVLITTEQDKMLKELNDTVTQMKLQWDDYLQKVKKSEQDIKNNYKEDAKRRVTYGLLLRAIAKEEHILASEEEVRRQANAILEQYAPAQREKIDEGHVREYAYGIIMNEKTFQILEKSD